MDPIAPMRAHEVDVMDLRPSGAERTELSEPYRTHWRRNRQITVVLLLLWTAVTFGLGYLAGDLQFDFFGWPFSFWVAAQGAPLVYVAIVWWYARAMDRIDRDAGLEDDGTP
jgi:putative solute:sodium symporter small subunit